MCSQEGLHDFQNEKYMVSYLGRAQLLLPPAIVFLEYLSREDKLQLGSLGPICLLPQFCTYLRSLWHEINLCFKIVFFSSSSMSRGVVICSMFK